MIMRQISLGLLDRLLPHHCPICDYDRGSYGLCASCWSDLSFLPTPACIACARPLLFLRTHHDITGRILCGPCSYQPSRLRYRRAPLRYDTATKALILPFKHAGRLDLGLLMAQLMRPSFDSLITDEHLIMPIPLHYTRRLYRRYNQSAELARHLCRQTNRLSQLDLITCYRRKATSSLGRHNHSKRKAILAKAFAIRQSRQSLITDRPILLIDDVMTTGQTFETAAKTLLSAGASAVDGLTFARII